MQADSSNPEVAGAPPEDQALAERTVDPLSSDLEKVKISDDARARLKGWLNRKLKIIITDSRLVEGTFICTDRDGNIILENTWEFTNYVGDTPTNTRGLGLTMVPGKHIKSIWLSND